MRIDKAPKVCVCLFTRPHLFFVVSRTTTAEAIQTLNGLFVNVNECLATKTIVISGRPSLFSGQYFHQPKCEPIINNDKIELDSAK